MKTTALILLSSCLSLWGQTTGNDTNLAVDSAMRDEILRRAVRQFEPNDQATATNTASPVVATTPPAAVPVSFVPAIPAPAALSNTAPAMTTINPVAPSVMPVVTANPPGAPALVVPVVPAPAPGSAAARLSGTRLQPPGGVPAPAFPTPFPTPFAAVTPPAAPPFAPAVVPVAVAPARPVEEATNVIEFPSIDLNTFLGVYSGIVDRTLLHGPIPNATISLRTQKPLTKTELIQAMDTVLAMNGITMVNQGANFVQVVSAAESAGSGAQFSTNKAENIPEAMQYLSQIVQLKYTKPSEIAPMLQPFAKIPGNIYPIEGSQMLVIRDYAINVKRMMELIQQVDVIAPVEYDQEIIPIKYAKVSDIASALGSLGAGSAASIGSRASSGGAGTRGGTSAYGGAPGGVGGIGAPGGSPFAAGAGAAGARGAVQSGLQSRLAGVAGAAGRGGPGDIQIFTGATKIVSDERSHSLLVIAGHQDMEMIKSIVKKLDVVLQQVLIEAIIMEVNLDDEQNIGVSYLQTTQSQGSYLSGIGALNNGTFLNNASFIGTGTNGAGSLAGGFNYLAHFGNDFDATATAIATDSKINVLSKPHIQTSDGVPASLKVGDSVPEVTGTYFGGISGQASSQYQQTFVGIDLEVTPQINSEGLVVMDISQDVEQLGPFTTIDGNQVPTTTQRTASSTVSVRDGDTIILGGFISSTKSKSHSGVPGLKDIPVLGYLFRSSSDSIQRVELIVLIHPKVLPTPEIANLATTQLLNNMPSLKAAQREVQIDENKRLKAADKITVPAERQQQ